jgi:hypothetical protein
LYPPAGADDLENKGQKNGQNSAKNMNLKRSNAMETQSNVSGVSKGTNKGGTAHDKHCLAPECIMKKIPGKDWARHVKT